MFLVCDFHIHSKYSRATSKDMNLEVLDEWAHKKGVNILSCGDFTHPIWFKELKTKLIPAEPGLFKLKNSKFNTRFILTTEISSIYNKNNKTRRIHNLIFMPSLETVAKFNAKLSLLGNLVSDGRPILGVGAKELLKITLEISPDSFFVPAHIWTPWFSLFGSMSGFNSIEECFDEYSKYIHAMETGLSSDPAMNWRWSELDNITLISNSDSHSPQKISREANVFDCELNYFEIIKAIKEKNPKKFLYTTEFFPEEGKYHFDGHRLCKISFSPEETKRHNNICPVCNKHLTLGVMYRINELSDHPLGRQPEKFIPFKNLVQLDEIIAASLKKTVITKIVQKTYNNLIEKFNNEFNILLNTPISNIQDVAGPEIADGIEKIREGRVTLEPGYDGEYGKIKIFEKPDNSKSENQKTLF